jgi:hypothetical protein
MFSPWIMTSRAISSAQLTGANAELSTTRSTALPKATEQPANASRDQYGRQRPLPEELLAGARAAVHFVAPLLTVFRRSLAHLPELFLGSVPYGCAYFLDVFSYFFRLFAKSFTRGRHVVSLHKSVGNQV